MDVEAFEARERAKDTGMALALACLLVGLLGGVRIMYPVAVLVLLAAMAAPGLFGPASRVWFGLSHVLGAVMSRVLLTLVFFLVVTPVGLVRRVMGKDSLELSRFKQDEKSAFVVREGVFKPQDLERPF